MFGFADVHENKGDRMLAGSRRVPKEEEKVEDVVRMHIYTSCRLPIKTARDLEDECACEEKVGQPSQSPR